MSQTAAPREGEQRCKIIAAAERLFREIGYQKTTVADIARALGMSPANVYRFFGAKSEINQAVGRQMMREVEEALREIALGPGSASQRLFDLVTANEAMNAARYVSDRKLHDMVEAALTENWPIIAEHIGNVDACLELVIESGVKSGEFAPLDPKLGARLVHTACIRYCHPRLLVECADHAVPSSAQMIDFCLKALRNGR
ncbi:TetR/AcrR family transcriptional regulator [Methylocystis heyeri]|uniref:TetR family transcriptional regulator n=1 Tax=Methylocystis heyeri TaxID=391905 RepID=A0A6B8KJW6_9HYPH|nr:TetR family transcriptional regulator [Methylocystis heyeri]QGM47839.1 TetR family transcriptional regulator [Methylocystis heyeri]